MAALLTTLRSSITISAPTDLTGLTAWYDGSDANVLFTDSGVTKVTTDAQAVQQWNDKSGNGYHLTAAAANNRPAYKTAIQGGKSVVRLDGTDDVMTSGAITSVVSPYSLFLVLAKRSANVVTTNKDAFIGAVSFAPDIFAKIGTPATWGYYAGTAQDSGTTVDVSFHEVHGIFNGASSRLVLDGTTISSANPGTTATGTTGFKIGNTAAGWDFDMAEVVFYSRALTADNESAVRVYLKAKWGTA